MSDFEPKIVAFACNWCAYAAADLAGTSRMSYPPNVELIRVMCSGMVDPIYVLRAFEMGFDGVLIAGCHPGDCHYISGNLKAEERVKALQRLLHTLGFEDGRLRLEWCSTAEGEKFATTVKEFVAKLKELGPSPFRIREEAVA
jgi:F420-non-reducing hydrogenase iron-sulfur subunit